MYVFLSFLSLFLASVAFAQPTGGPGGPANCATATTLLCLAGRSGTANNPTISTSTDGIITGSSNASTNVLKLRGNTATSRTAAGSEITVGDNVTSVATNGGAYSPFEFTAAFSFDTNASIVNVYNTGEHKLITVNSTQNDVGGVRGFVYAPLIRAGADFDNSPASDDMGHWIGLVVTPFIQSDTGKKATIDHVTGIYDIGVLCSTPTFLCDHATGDAATVVQWTGHWFKPATDSNNTSITKASGFLNNVDNTRGTISELNTVEDEPTIGSGRTLPIRRGLYFKDRLSTGTQTEAYAVDVPDLTVGTRVAAVKSAIATGTGKWHLYLTGTAPSLFGGIIAGSESADGTLTLQGTTNADNGAVQINPTFSGSDATETLLSVGSYSFSGGTATNMRDISMTESVVSTGAVGHGWRGIYAAPAINSTGTDVGLLATGYLVEFSPTISVGTGAGNSIPFIRVLHAAPVFTITGATADTLTPSPTAAQAALTYMPTFNATKNGTTSGGLCGTNAGCGTFTYDNAVYYRPTLATDDANTRITITNSNGLYVANATNSGAGTEEITTQSGITIEALTFGTNNLPIQIGEVAASATGSVASGFGAITVTSGAPNRITFVNENEQRFDAGYATWTGGTNTALLADNTSRFFPVNDRAAADTTESTHDMAAPGALTVVYMACGLDVDPANGASVQSRTFTLMEDTVADAPACTISEGATSCTWCQTGTSGCSATGTAEVIDSGDMIDIRASAANTPAASDATCTIWYTLNAF